MIDCAFRTEEGRFYYCVRGIIIRDGKLLVAHDEVAPYGGLIGGKVAMGETAEQAILREVKEELGVDAKIVRALWFDQSFYTEKIKREPYHELGLYFLLDADENALKENEFILKEGKHTLKFTWLPIEKLEEEYLYPEFLKKEIFNLPENLKMIVEKE